MGQGESSGNENSRIGSNPELRGLEDRLTEKVKNLTGSGVSELRRFEERLDELTSDLQVERRERVTSETRLEALYADVREATDNEHVVRNIALLSADVCEVKQRLKAVTAMAEQTKKEIAVSGGRHPPGSGTLKPPGSEEALPDDLRRLRIAVDACVRQIANEKALFEEQRIELQASFTEVQERFGGDLGACRESIAASTMERQAQELSIKSLLTQEQAAREVGHSSLRELLEQQAKSLGDKLAKMGADWEVERSDVQRQIAKAASVSAPSRSGPQAAPSSQIVELQDSVAQQVQRQEAGHAALHELMRGHEAALVKHHTTVQNILDQEQAAREGSHEQLLKGILDNKEQIKNQQQASEAILKVLQSAGLGEAQDDVFTKDPASPEEPAPPQLAPLKDWKAVPEQEMSRLVDPLVPLVPRPVVPDKPQSPTPPKAVMAAGMLPLRFLSSPTGVPPKAGAGGGGSKPRTVSPTMPSAKRQLSPGDSPSYPSPRIQGIFSGGNVGMPVAGATASAPPSGAAGSSSNLPPTAGGASGLPLSTPGDGGSLGPFMSSRFGASDARGGQGSPARERRPWQSSPASDFGPAARPPSAS